MSARQELVDHLVRTRIAGEVGTSRQENLRNVDRMLDDRPDYWFGVRRRRDWTADEVLEVLVQRVGVHPDRDYRAGVDTIDPQLTVAALDRWRARLALAAGRRERVLLATGHPTGVLSLHVQVAAALRAAGCAVLAVAPDWSWPFDAGDPRRDRHVRCVAGVHVLATGGELLHTHRPEPMDAVLAALDALPDLVVADHGWAGAAAQAGVDTLAMADCNDPALFVGEHEGLPLVTVPLDDNVLPHLYDPLAAWVTAGWP